MCCLYHLALSPFCRKVRLILAEKKLEVNLIEEPILEKRFEFFTHSSSSKVPVLQINGLVISESNAIFEYLEEVYPDPPLLPEIMADKVEARRLSCWFDDTFHREVTAKLLYQRIYKNLSGTDHVDSGIMKSGMTALKLHFQSIGELLEKRRWLAGDKMTIADFAGAAHISSLDYIGDIDWEKFDSIKNWYVKIKSRPAFRSLLKDYLPAFVPPEHYEDLDF